MIKMKLINSAEPSFTFNINLATTKLQSPVHAVLLLYRWMCNVISLRGQKCLTRIN